MIKTNRILQFTLILLLFTACNGPKTAEPFSLTKSIATDSDIIDKEMHEVVVKEVLPATKYVYLKVTEKGREYWISAPKKDIKEGNSYVYNEALLKTQFESKEYNRIFDTIYLVTTIVPKEHGLPPITSPVPKAGKEKGESVTTAEGDTPEVRGQFAGAIKIAELVKNPAAYENKMVELTGECVKVNEGIMDRNWIHLKDGSQDDYDLVITTKETVEKGTTITIRAIVALNKDFGSGYMYPILLEHGRVLQ
ncbi:MAG: hypothetical protein HKN52_08620 [Eudoraea sp.]|nr:hypothetical protein [Eudoraea sp.]